MCRIALPIFAISFRHRHFTTQSVLHSPRLQSRRSIHGTTEDVASVRSVNVSESEDDDEDEDRAFVFGIWLRHRRIDGALNRVPLNFYADVWDILYQFPRGLRVAGNTLPKGLTQEVC